MAVKRAAPLSTRKLLQKVGAEMIGTFALVFAGCGAIVVDRVTGGAIGHAGISAVFGLVIMVMIYATGHISGAHFNPAVTIAFAMCKRFPWRQVPAYIAGQVAAALIAAVALRAVFGDVAHLGATGVSTTLGAAAVMEVVLTLFLMFVIIAVATDSRAVGAMAGWAIGGTVALGALVGGPISGASLNPARSLGPAIAAGHYDDLGLYLVAPTVGAVLGALAYVTVQCDDDATTADGCC